MNKEIIYNANIITMNDTLDIYYNGSILIQNGKIKVISNEKISDETAYYTNANGMYVMPGLINTHTHVPMTLFRGFADDLPLHKWLTEYIFPAEAKYITPANVKIASQLAFLEMISSGTTCFNDMYFFEDIIAEEAQKAGIRAVLSDSLIDFPTPSFKNVEEGLAIDEALIQKWKDNDIIHPSVCVHSPYTCSKATLQKAKSLADKYNTLLHIHVAETQKEVDDIIKQTGLTPADYLNNIGLLDSNVIAAHCVWLNQEDIKLFADSHTSIAHCPKSNLKLASGIADTYAYSKFGIQVGVGTDGTASNNTLDMVEEMRFTALLPKTIHYDPEAMSAKETLKAVTINGAKALGLGDITGSLEVGKEADLIMISTDSSNMAPIYDPYSTIVYAMNSRDIQASMVHGKWIMKDREVLYIDKTNTFSQLSPVINTIK